MTRVLATIVLAATIGTAAADTAPLVDGLRRCAREAEDTQRLMCFDELAKSVPAHKADEFGMTAMIAHERTPTAPFQPRQQDVLVATIAALREGSPGRFIFTLDNAQVWLQAEAQPRVRFSVGENVEIQHGAMGSLWLAASKGRKTRVTRMR